MLLNSSVHRRLGWKNKIGYRMVTLCGTAVAFPLIDVALVTRYLCVDASTIPGEFGDFLACVDLQR